ncbi:MAG: lysophospholipid acyltransferase family protein [Kiloniellaceae bacterium]
MPRYLRYPLEAAGLFLAVGLFRLLPVDLASNLGGFLGRTIGPRLGITRRAQRNLRLAFPEKSKAEIAGIVRGMWDNLGRVAAEYPHLGRITARDSGRVAWVEMAPVDALGDENKPRIFVSGHLANWEIMSVAAVRRGVDLTVIVREPNNPLVRALVERLRGVAGGGRSPKGPVGAKQAVNVLRQGRVLGLLIDQKMNDGIPVPFFGIDAMTAAAPAQLAMHFKCPIVPVRIERTGPARFAISSLPPLELPESGDRQADAAQIMAELNHILEGWIRARPQDWLWLHRRWPAAAYREGGPESRAAEAGSQGQE